jgi:hypothetical protein
MTTVMEVEVTENEGGEGGKFSWSLVRSGTTNETICLLQLMAILDLTRDESFLTKEQIDAITEKTNEIARSYVTLVEAAATEEIQKRNQFHGRAKHH